MKKKKEKGKEQEKESKGKERKRRGKCKERKLKDSSARGRSQAFSNTSGGKKNSLNKDSRWCGGTRVLA